MPTFLVVGVDKLEDWLCALGCVKGECPTPFVCIWKPPGDLLPFTAPNPETVHFVPLGQMGRLGRIIQDIMNSGQLGSL